MPYVILDLLGVLEVRWDGGDTARGADCTFHYELYDMYSPNIIRVVKSRRMRWAGHVACMGGGGEMLTRFWWEDLREGDHLEDPGVDGRILLKWILKRWDGGMGGIDLAQERDKRRALVNAVMNLQVSENRGNLLTS